MIHSCTHRVRSYELDGNNHVNNAVYLQYFEYARMEFLRDIGFDYRKFRDLGYSLFVTEISVQYRQAATVLDDLTITTVPVKKGRASGVFRQTVYRGETELCRADVKWACINGEGRPEALPEEFDRNELRPGPVES